MDVHPPLAKLMLTFAGYISGLDPSFGFKQIGLDYVEPNVPYVTMRSLPALLGALVPPIAYLTLRVSKVNTGIALLTSVLIIFGKSS
jgi:dolichyl-phosphate-mannose-protein mannosyltransferase